MGLTLRRATLVTLAFGVVAFGAFRVVRPRLERRSALVGQPQVAAQFMVSADGESATLQLTGRAAAELALVLASALDGEDAAQVNEPDFSVWGHGVHCGRWPVGQTTYSCSLFLQATELGFFSSPAVKGVFAPAAVSLGSSSFGSGRVTYQWSAPSIANQSLTEFCEYHHGHVAGSPVRLTCSPTAQGTLTGQLELDFGGVTTRSATVKPNPNEGTDSACRLAWPSEAGFLAARAWSAPGDCRSWCERAVLAFSQNNPDEANQAWLVECQWHGAALPFSNSVRAPRATVETLGALSLLPGAATVHSPTVLAVGFELSPPAFSGTLELVEVGEAGQRLATLGQVEVPPLAARARGATRHVLGHPTVTFERLGECRVQLVAPEGAATSPVEVFDVFPKGVPTGSRVADLGHPVKWRGREVVSNELFVRLRKPKDFATAQRLAESVGMRLVGYAHHHENWQFAFAEEGTAARLETAYVALTANAAVAAVEPDGVLHVTD